MRHLGLGKPRRQRQKALRGGRKPPQLRSNLAVRRDRSRSPSDARPIPRIVDAASPSRSLQQDGRRDDPEKCTPSYELRTTGWKPPRLRQSKVRLCHPIKLILRLEASRVNPPLHRPPAQIARFIHRGARKRSLSRGRGMAVDDPLPSGSPRERRLRDISRRSRRGCDRACRPKSSDRSNRRAPNAAAGPSGTARSWQPVLSTYMAPLTTSRSLTWLDMRPSRVGQFVRITQPATVVASAIFVGPHRQPHQLIDRDRRRPRDATPPTPPGIWVSYHGGSTELGLGGHIDPGKTEQSK